MSSSIIRGQCGNNASVQAQCAEPHPSYDEFFLPFDGKMAVNEQALSSVSAATKPPFMFMDSLILQMSMFVSFFLYKHAFLCTVDRL